MKKNLDAEQAAVDESEEQLITRAQEALSRCRWVVGECAAKWTKRYARGRTDAEFGALLGLSGDQVFQRRRVWEVFAGLQGEFTSLKWSHFYAALNWDDARECLGWAEETRSTVAEMKAWRRARRGEDLTAEPMAEEGGPATIRFVPTETEWVQDPDAFRSGTGRGDSRGNTGSGDPDHATLAGVARQKDEDENYTPFRKGAGSPAPKEEPAGAAVNVEPPRIPPDQVVKRMTSTIERCVKILTPEFTREFRRLPEPVRNRFIKAVGELSSQAADLM